MGNGFGARLKNLRKEFSLTQEALAARLGVSSSTVGMYEQNRRMPDQATLASICNIFGVTADFLLGYEHTEPVQSDNLSDAVENFVSYIVNHKNLMYNGYALAENDRQKIADAIHLATMLSASNLNKKNDK